MIESNNMKLSFTNFDRIYVVVILIWIIIIKQKQNQQTLNRRTQSKKGDEKIHPMVLLINSL